MNTSDASVVSLAYLRHALYTFPPGGPLLGVIDLVPDTFNWRSNAPDGDEFVVFHAARGYLAFMGAAIITALSFR